MDRANEGLGGEQYGHTKDLRPLGFLAFFWLLYIAIGGTNYS